MTDVITDFNDGTSSTTVDRVFFSDAGIEGLTNATAWEDTGGGAVGAGALVYSALGTDGATMTDVNIVGMIGTYATSTLALAALQTTGASTINFSGTLGAADDVFLVAYDTGSDVAIAVVAVADSQGDSDGCDTIDVILTLQDIADLTDLNSSDFRAY